MSTSRFTRRGLLKNSAVAGAGLAMPTIFTASSAAAYTNEPTGGSVTLGFNVPQTGPYADEGADELLAQQLAVEHLNGEGDGGCLNTFTSKALKGNGILGKKVEFVTGDTQTKNEVVEIGKAETVDVNITMGVGELTVRGGATDLMDAE